MSFGPLEWIIVLVVVLLLFGAKRLPELARSLGRSSKAFKEGLKEGATDEDEKPAAKASEDAPKRSEVPPG